MAFLWGKAGGPCPDFRTWTASDDTRCGHRLRIKIGAYRFVVSRPSHGNCTVRRMGHPGWWWFLEFILRGGGICGGCHCILRNLSCNNGLLQRHFLCDSRSRRRVPGMPSPSYFAVTMSLNAAAAWFPSALSGEKKRNIMIGHTGITWPNDVFPCRDLSLGPRWRGEKFVVW